MNKENQLNDEEIVKSFEEMYVLGKFRAKTIEKTLALIYRLQDEKKEYETLFDIYNERKYRKMFNEEWKKEYQKELDKQGEGVIAGFPDGDYVYRRYFEQKAEIERLTEQSGKHIIDCDYWKNRNNVLADSYKKLEKQNTELQKQVDDLKEKIMNLKFAMIDRVARKSYDSLLTMPEDVEEVFGDAYESEFNKFLGQAVKDTAREILLSLIGCEKQIDPLETGIRWSVLKGFCKKFGVEAE